MRARVGQRAADLSGSTIAPVVITRCGRSSRSRRFDRHHNPGGSSTRTYCEADGIPACAVPSRRPNPYAPVVAPAQGMLTLLLACDLPYCRSCHKTVHRDDEGQVSEADAHKLRWRHICHYICGYPATPAAVQAHHDFETAMSALALRSDMQLDVPLSVLDVSLPVERQALMAFLLDPGSVCTAAPHALPSCTRVVSNLLTAIGHAVCTAPLLAECVPPVPSTAARGQCSYEYHYGALYIQPTQPTTLPNRPPQPTAPATPATPSSTRGHWLVRPAKGVRAARARRPSPTSRPSPYEHGY
jgi:hypothetical protein